VLIKVKGFFHPEMLARISMNSLHSLIFPSPNRGEVYSNEFLWKVFLLAVLSPQDLQNPLNIWFWNISEQDVNLQKIRQEKNTEEKRLFADTLARSYEYVTIA